MAATGAVGDEQRVLARGADLGKQCELGHFHRDRVVPGLVAEAAGHAAAGGLDRLDFQLRDERKRLPHRRHRAEGLLVAMAVQERALLGERLELEREAAGFVLEREELLEEQRCVRERVGLAAREHRLEFVAQGQKAGRLEADDIDAASHVGLERGQHPLRLGLRLLDHSRREESAAAAQRPRTIRSTRNVHAVARPVEHGESGARVFRLEVVVERVDEEHDLAGLSVTARSAQRVEERAAPLRQGALRCEAESALAHPLDRVRRPWEARGQRTVAGQVGDQPVLQRIAVAGVIVTQELDLHLRHVHAGRAFAPAALAVNAQVQRLEHLVRREGIGAELAGEREAQRVGAPAGEVPLVAGRAERRAHRTGVELAAVTVVVAHLDRRRETLARRARSVPLAPVEHGIQALGRIPRLEAEQRPFVLLRRPHDLSRVQEALGIEEVLDLFERAHKPFTDDGRYPLRAHQTVAVLPRIGGALVFFHQLQASSAIARIFFAPSFFMSRIGRTCKVPTEAWAYQVPSVPCLRKTCVSESVYSARFSSGTAQSSMKETGLPSPFIDIMMLRPAFLTSHTSRWSAASTMRITLPGLPRSAISAARCSSLSAGPSRSSPTNSTSRIASGSPWTNFSTTVR